MPRDAAERWEIDGHQIRISSLDKVYWPDDSGTKGDVLHFYRQISGIVLPYLRNRPVTLRACPNGINGSQFWRRAKAGNAPDWLPSVSYRPESRKVRVDVPIINDEAALIWYADHSVVEIHMWMSLSRDLQHPDLAVFDLDPGATMAFEQVLKAALCVRDELDKHALQGFAKTSGATGMHIFVPIAPRNSFEDVRKWVHDTARQLEERYPELIAAASGGTHHSDVVTIDHAQNSIARNTAAPYTLRSRPGAPVSTPVTWAEVESGKIRPDQFTLRTVPARLDREGDPWSAALQIRQTLPIDA